MDRVPRYEMRLTIAAVAAITAPRVFASARAAADPVCIEYRWGNWNIVRETRVSGLASRVSSPVSNVTYNLWGLDIDGTLKQRRN